VVAKVEVLNGTEPEIMYNVLASGEPIALYSACVNVTTCCTTGELVNVSVLFPNTLPVTEPDTFNEPDIVSLPMNVFEPVVANEPVLIGVTFKANEAVVANDAETAFCACEADIANEAVPCKEPVYPFTEFTEPVKLEGPFTTLNVPYNV
jgi:hypothetical protein